MSNEELVRLIQDNQNVNDNMTALWQQNSGYIAKIAIHYSYCDDIEDLKQQGYLGLYEAVKRYKAEKGINFLTYATYWIIQSIQKYVAECCHAVRIPANIYRQIQAYKSIITDMLLYYGYIPTETEIKKYLGIKQKQLEAIKQGLQFSSIKSLDSLINEDGDIYLYELIAGTADTENTVIDNLTYEQLKKILWDMVEQLKEEQRVVLKSRYQDNKTMKEIQKSMNINQVQLYNTYAESIRELRKPYRIRLLKPFKDELIEVKAMKGTGYNSFNRTWTSATERTALKL